MDQSGQVDAVPQCTHWYAIRTRSRHEKKVAAQLAGRGVEPFLPLAKRWSRWKDRRKWIEVPLFPGYCFGRFGVEARALVLKVAGVVSLVGKGGVPEPVSDDEIEAVRRVVAGPLPYDPCPELIPGRPVEVIRGPLMGVRGLLVRKDAKARLLVVVNAIRQGASLEIDAADVAPL
ncbi:MAG: UpxY family transcription antiterminator [Candidatus Rokubacteria bacterium]|nr:UpxY family transcription antiterminator [Candidatus Rokubacteria bacterium]